MLLLNNLRSIASASVRERNSVCRNCGSPSSPMSSFHGHQKVHQRRLKTAEEVQHEKDCQVLGVPENCTDESFVRDAYIKLAKRFHPDSGSTEASASKFQQIDEAYKNFLKYFADFRHNRHKIEGEYGLYYNEKKGKEPKGFEEEEKVESPDIKHTAPQHRQYLSFDGVGSGTPRQREKQYQKWRAMKAIENVLDHRMEQVSRNSGQEVWDLAKEQRAAKKIKTGIGIERLVEDMIQESMAKGDFDNLSGKGKPLNSSKAYNPYCEKI